jgi:hypothetical protein
MQPESSDGLASVGTILPEERAARISDGSSRFCTSISHRIKRDSTALPLSSRAVNSMLEFADVAQLVEQLIRNQ